MFHMERHPRNTLTIIIIIIIIIIGLRNDYVVLFFAHVPNPPLW